MVPADEGDDPFYAEADYVYVASPLAGQGRPGPSPQAAAEDEFYRIVPIEIPDEQEDEVEKFREFLDQISPEDFGAGSGSGGQ